MTSPKSTNIELLQVALIPFHLVPLAGITISSALRALGTARVLHQPVREFFFCLLLPGNH